MKTMVYSLLIVAVTYVCQGVNSASVSDTSGSPPDCSTYKIDSAVLHVTPPEPKAKSAIGKIFASLHGELNATLVPQPSGPSCYEWDCQSHERLGQKCRWCLPSIFIGGIAKCGTTALCDKLVSHPSVRFYRNKETDLFTKFHFSIAEFEKKINTEYMTSSINISTDSANSDHNNNPLNKRALKKNHQQMRAAAKYVDDSRHVGNVWLDCSAGAFRDFNAAAHLRKYSPDTKVVMIVRDPWQTIGSRMAQQTRNGGVKFQTAIRQTSSQFKKIQYPPEERFGEAALRHVTAGTDYTYAEKLLHWVAAFPEPDKLLMVDQYNLQHHPQDTMHRLETFLNIAHFNYSQDVLHGVSHNANVNRTARTSQQQAKEQQGRIENSRDTHLPTSVYSVNSTEDKGDIHRPYDFSEHSRFLLLSRNVLHPSLCLFEQAFGWKIRITTNSELSHRKYV